MKIIINTALPHDPPRVQHDLATSARWKRLLRDLGLGIRGREPRLETC